MKQKRRTFLKTAVCGTGVFAAGELLAAKHGTSSQGRRFNMCGYAAPKLDTVRIGFIGVGARGGGFGGRGVGAVERFTFLEGVKLAAFSDLYEDRIEYCQQILSKKGLPRARGYAGSREGWKAVCESSDIDLVYICTPWALHTPMAVYAMECGKHVAVEVPAGKTVEECWQLVEVSERTRKHCMMLENCCYDFFELLTLNMVRQGLFGEIIHGEGSYLHFNRSLYLDKTYYAEMWRLKEETRNGNLYPTHGMGPICQIMNINRGDRMEYLVSMQSADFVMARMVDDLATRDAFYKPFAGKSYRGNINSTMVHTAKGRTILSQHDVTTPRPYSRTHLVLGTQAVAMKWPLPPRIALGGHNWVKPEEMKKLEERYTPEIVRKVGALAKKVGGHGGMDFLMDWRLIDCLRHGRPLDQDVYDAASWSCVAPLTEHSVSHRSASVDIPDFTRGAWKTNAPFDLILGESTAASSC